jgi:hypothetical protein
LPLARGFLEFGFVVIGNPGLPEDPVPNSPSHVIKSQQIEFASRPDGVPTLANFNTTTVELSAVGDGELLINNHWMSVDPYMRGRMREDKSRSDAPDIAFIFSRHLGRITADSFPATLRLKRRTMPLTRDCRSVVYLSDERGYLLPMQYRCWSLRKRS